MDFFVRVDRPQSPEAWTVLQGEMSSQYTRLSIARLSGCKLLSNPPGLPALQVVVETNDTVDAYNYLFVL